MQLSALSRGLIVSSVVQTLIGLGQAMLQTSFSFLLSQHYQLSTHVRCARLSGWHAALLRND